MKLRYCIVAFLLGCSYHFGQVVNEGILKIEDGTTVYFEDDYTNKSGATHTNEGDLHLNGNLINNGTMSESASADVANGITYFNSPTNVSSPVNLTQTISGTNKVVFENLQVNMTNGSSLGVSVADGMEVIVEKGINLVDGDIRLVGEAQVIQKHTGTNANAGSGNLLRDQQGTVDTYNYNYWSSPVTESGGSTYMVGNVLFDGSDSTMNPFTPTAATFSTGSPWNGTPSVLSGGNVTTPLNLETYWIYKFENGDIDDDNDWELMRETGAISAGIGYTLKGAGASGASQNYVFKGSPNDGTYTFAIGVNKSTMLGNPYPCAMDANEFITDNATVLADVTTPSATTGAIYYWEHWGGGTHLQQGYQGGYATYTLAGGTPPTTHPDVTAGGSNSGINGSRYIPVAQGFFVESNTGGTITIDNSHRVFKTEDATSYFRRPNNPKTEIPERNDADTDTMQRIRLGYNSPEGFYRQIMTAFVPECNDGHNIGYDARMAYIHNDEMFWNINGTAYVIDARPFHIDKEIPIGIKVGEAGTHKIFLFETENFDGDVFILDTDTQYTHDIRVSDFEVDLEVGEYWDRFKLVFTPRTPLNVEEVLQESLQVFYANTQQDVVIKNPNNLEIKSVTIFNAIGQLIKKADANVLTNTIEIRVPLHVTSGTYVISIETNIGQGGFKVIAH